MTTEENKDAMSVEDDSFVDIDLIEVDDLIDSANRLLVEVFNDQVPQLPTPPSDAREDAIEQVQRFLRSIRERDENQDDDVVFVAARPGNALPSSAQISTAVVDLCSPAVNDEAQQAVAPRRRGRRSSAAISLFQNEASPPKSRRLRPKVEPGTAAAATSVKSTKAEPNSPVTQDSNNKPSLMCAVCMDTVVNRQPSSTACGHIFCQKCILQAVRLTKKCPLCNTKLKPNQVHRLYF